MTSRMFRAALAFGLSVAAAFPAEEARRVILDDAWAGADGARFSGRLVEARSVPAADDKAARTVWKNTRQLLTGGEEGFVTWRVAGHEWTTRTDDDGYWSLAMSPAPAFAPGWHEVECAPPADEGAGLLVVAPGNRLGIISDVDDTVLVSEVTNKRALLRNSLAVPPERRAAVPGMAALYARLLARNPEPAASAMFYVSASPRQLTGNVRTFLRANGFPRGVLHLKEFSENGGASLADQRDYKRSAIEAILRAHPDVRFALFGDDGEQDPEIYAALQSAYPGQIEGVWIRRVHPDPKRARLDGQSDVLSLLSP